MNVCTRAMAAAILTCAALFGGVPAAEPGLLAHWSFDKVIDDQTPEVTGQGLPARVVGAKGVPRGDGLALRFDGETSYVDCGAAANLEVKDAVSLSVWVFAEALPSAEPAIAMRHDTTSWGLTLYRDGRCWWYIADGGNAVKAPLGLGGWHHVVGTYDGRESRLYVDGALADARPLAVPLRNEGRLLIGKRGTAEMYFKGLVDDVKVYGRALSAEEIAATYRASAATMVTVRRSATSGESLRGAGFTARLTPAGALHVEIGGETYFVETSLSFPGKSIGFNRLGDEPGDDPSWKPRTARDGDAATVSAAGRHYSLQRTVRVKGHRIEISDTLTNTSAEPVGVLVDHHVITAAPTPEFILCGLPASGGNLAENPTVLARQAASQLGAVAEDSLFRAQFEARAAVNVAAFGLRHLGLAPGARVTLDWALYPMGKDSDYWTFINRLREDWGVNFTLVGPGNTFNVTQPDIWKTFTDRARCAAYLQRSRLKILMLAPWVDYDNLDHRTGELTTREEFRKITRDVKAVVKAVDPEVRIIGCIEAPFVSLPRPTVDRMVATFPPGMQTGYLEFTPEQTALLKSDATAWARWSDSIVVMRDGRMKFEYYHRGKWPMIALTVRPVLGNGQHAYLMDQARHLIEECGLDGFYVDSFTGAKHWHYGYSYDKWDGVTVDIDAATGAVTAKYTDCALAGTAHRRVFMEYGLKQGGLVVTNGHPIARETQAMPVHRFNEGEWSVDVYATPDGTKPPLAAALCEAHLASPISLGTRPNRYGEERSARDYSRIIMRTVIHFLRHGVLYFHYGTDMPAEGPGGGEYGPINHMFPITPVRIGEGFVEGRERIVTCVSHAFDMTRDAEPRILLFDLTGRAKPHTLKAVRTATGWSVPIRLADWAEIAVVE